MNGVQSHAARFVAIAVLGFLVQAAVLYALTAGAIVPMPLAVAIAVECAILHNFFWHERWTFAARGCARGAWLVRLWRFNGAAAVMSVAGNVILTAAFVTLMPMPLVAANALAVAALGVVNFLLADRWVFRS